ncbi:hypothetical protein GCM10009564_54600 [Streptomyces thermogriseus]|uniref:Porphobilinogen deaminase N-terminal domain-containing protein n=1 Tax=Streptomyces thermogriseus TaxID=75292 RepID=A0ABN1T705_9ACTN
MPACRPVPPSPPRPSAAQPRINRVRPDLDAVRGRGLVGTRLDEFDGRRTMEHKPDARVLARAGLERLGLEGIPH